MTDLMFAALVILAAVVPGLLYLLFRDTLNRVQYFPFKTNRAIYWIARDTGVERVGKSFMKMTAPPWLQGTGFTVTYRQFSFQVGLAKRKSFLTTDEALKDILGASDLNIGIDEIRGMDRGNLQRK